MGTDSIQIQDRIAAVKDGIAQAAVKAGRSPADIRLIAVSKWVENERIEQAVQAGLSEFGENYVQEWMTKQCLFPQILWHLIGQMQTNKVKYIVGEVQLLQTLDNLKLAAEIEKRCASQGLTQEALVQVNIGDEPQKGGIPAGSLSSFLEQVAGMPHIKVQGLMAIPPVATAEEARPYFQSMRTLFERHQNFHDRINMQWLSMGMSHDYRIAIEEGSTMVRIGTAIFGSRSPRNG